MVEVKLSVVLIYMIVSCKSIVDYCKICSNHTLCLYSSTEPGQDCGAYDTTALLASQDIKKIVDRINERRNFVAIGLANFLPQAANMNKIVWSQELSTFAQRWVDQCDQNLHPNKEDICRDLVDMEVGQIIATIVGPTTGLNVKSFVDMWFMPILIYKGNVVYFNESRDRGISQFTQLIWAESDSVGCGRARFYLKSKQMMAERLVCNFAPKGNCVGKPIYTIGYPSTQCRDNTVPDHRYPGLCTKQFIKPARKFKARTFPPSSLLRVLNLSNNSTKREIDPIRNNIKQLLFGNDTVEHRSQKSRHIYFDKTQDNIQNNRRSYFKSLQKDLSLDKKHNCNTVSKGHSRILKFNENQKHCVHQVQHDGIKESTKNIDSETSRGNFGNWKTNRKCTRRMITNQQPAMPSDNRAKYSVTNVCTRKTHYEPTNSYQTTTTSYKTSFDFTESPAVTELCPCNIKTTTSMIVPTICNCHTNCKCLENKSPTLRTTRGFHFRRSEPIKNPNPINFNYHDIFPNIEVRNGGQIMSKKRLTSLYSWITTSYPTNSAMIERISLMNPYQKSNPGYTNDVYETRKKRQYGLNTEATYKPFWQMDEFHNVMPAELRSMQYSAMPNKRSRIATKMPKVKTKTESITLTPSHLKNKNHKDTVSEKYLSFEELMHLRKLNPDDKIHDGRRKEENKDTTTTTITTTEYTANTPYIRSKHCTRKLTCTWTAFTGNETGNKGIPNHGSRTPPGYVDGCTRTSTCTREFMDRNKWPTSAESVGETTANDEDYCEKRSLNLHRRKSELDTATDYFDNKETSTLVPIDTTISMGLFSIEKTVDSVNSNEDCICNDN